jgi:hypothetical protein
MLYSHQHKFIFIKTLKTAGTSLEICFSRYMQDALDIITPISAADEKKRSRENIYPRNFGGPEMVLTKRRTNRVKSHFWNHMPAGEIRAKLPAGVWEQCRKITAERHPYEKTVSLAFFLYVQRRGLLTLPACLDIIIERKNISSMDLYCIDGKIIADTIIRYEHLLEDTNAFLASLDIPPVDELPRAKTQFRLVKQPAEELLSAQQKMKIRELCVREFEYFGYQA